MSVTPREQGAQTSIDAFAFDLKELRLRMSQLNGERPVREEGYEWPKRDTPLFAPRIPGPRYI